MLEAILAVLLFFPLFWVTGWLLIKTFDYFELRWRRKHPGQRRSPVWIEIKQGWWN